MFNLEECINNEFLRPRENRCKWFNKFGVMRKCVYIEKDGKCKISSKNNRVNRFTYCVNQFRQLNNKTDEQWSWYTSDTNWIDSNLPRWRLIWFKFLWINSIKVREFHDTIHWNLSRFRQERSEKYMLTTFESIQTFVNRFNGESIQENCESIQENFE